jgi:hypothetical protein
LRLKIRPLEIEEPSIIIVGQSSSGTEERVDAIDGCVEAILVGSTGREADLAFAHKVVREIIKAGRDKSVCQAVAPGAPAGLPVS